MREREESTDDPYKHSLHTLSGLFYRSLSIQNSFVYMIWTRLSLSPATMFKRSFAHRDRAGKLVKPVKTTFREHTVKKMQESLDIQSVGSGSPQLTSPIATIAVGPDQRMFAAHEDVLSLSPHLTTVLENSFFTPEGKRVDLPDEEPEIFSCILEYLYKGDYYPRMVQDKRRTTWELEDNKEFHKTGGRGVIGISTIFSEDVGGEVLRDTAVYCLAEKFGLDDLKRLALRKQGMHHGIPVEVILRSARYAYDHTPDTETTLRAHYLALIIRSRKTFKRSGTMQKEMQKGGKLYFDLFVAMCNHVDDIVEISNARSPKII